MAQRNVTMPFASATSALRNAPHVTEARSTSPSMCSPYPSVTSEYLGTWIIRPRLRWLTQPRIRS